MSSADFMCCARDKCDKNIYLAAKAMDSVKVRIRYSKEGPRFFPVIEVREPFSLKSYLESLASDDGDPEFGRLPMPVFINLTKTFDTIDAALDHGKRVVPAKLKERFGSGVQYDLEVVREAIEYADPSELFGDPSDADSELQVDTDIHGTIKAATREIWEKLKKTKVGRKDAASNVLDEILQIGVPRKRLVQMVRLLAYTKTVVPYWRHRVDMLRAQRDDAKRRLEKQKRESNREDKELEKNWDAFKQERLFARWSDNVVRELMAHADYIDARRKLADFAHLPLLHTKIAKLPTKIAATCFCNLFKHFVDDQQYGVVGRMMQATGLLDTRKKDHPEKEFQRLREQVRRLVNG